MFYDAAINAHGLRHDPFKALVAPRPIGWISSLDAEGRPNLAPYSFFNAISDNPHIVIFSSTGWKDSVQNVAETGEFVCNLATWDLREAVNATSAPAGHGVSEFELAGLTQAPCTMVKAPRVAETPVAMECKHLQTIHLKDVDGKDVDRWMVMGQVVGIHIDDAFIHDGMVDITELKPLARLGYKDYSIVDSVFQMARPAGGGGNAGGA
ncbi:flavin reductase family protein [Breoghania sp. L-A4]|uniref:flavin reductase family protein n=1 Tax=Breoghania sp. L-A4 TaxID=2304600 RepID=UPI000E35F870|nr:flavin reductase family protein [Breoghania sp. L-A4]AXS41089.1 flavin reductase family protein [Breoghania sp. L-A4]